MPVEQSDTSLLRLGADLIWVGVAALGGVARYLDGYLRGGQPPRLGLFVAHAAVSGFSGYMVAQTVLKFAPDWGLVAAGVGGYLGTQGLDWVASVIQQKFGGEPIPKQSVPPAVPPTTPTNGA